MRYLNVLIWVVSLILYFVAPSQYDFSFIVIVFALWGASAYLFIKKDIKEKMYVSFTILFTLSFFLTTFVVPLFYNNELFSSSIFFTRDYMRNMSRTTALANLGYSSLVCGYSLHKVKPLKKKTHLLYDNRRIVEVVVPSLILLLFITTIGNDIREADNNYTATWQQMFILLFSEVAWGFVFYSKVDSKGYWNRRKFIYLSMSSLLVIVSLLLFLGDRGLSIAISLTILAGFGLFIKRIKLTVFLAILAIGFFFLFFVADNRNYDTYLDDMSVDNIFNLEGGIIEKGSDLYAATFALNASYDMRNSFTQEQKSDVAFTELLRKVISPIPFNSHFLETLNIDDSITSPTRYIDRYYTTINGGIGTHCIASAFIPFGLLGVIILFFVFGVFVKEILSKKTESIYYTIIYLHLVSKSVYMARSDIINDALRATIYLIIILAIMKKYTFRQVSNR